MPARRSIVVGAAIVALLAAVPSARASHPDRYSEMHAWPLDSQNKVQMDFQTCRVDFTVMAQEFGDHGVEQFKLRFLWFLDDINPASPTVEWLRSVRFDSGWKYSSEFPDDVRNHWGRWRLIWSETSSAGRQTIRARAVGIRPSWWQPDLSVDLHLGQCDPQVILGM